MAIRAVTWDDARLCLARSVAKAFGTTAGVPVTSGPGAPDAVVIASGAAISVAGGSSPRFTPNHPVLSRSGTGAATATHAADQKPAGWQDPWGAVPANQPLGVIFMALNALRDVGVDPFNPPGWLSTTGQGFLVFGLGPTAPRCVCRAGQVTQVTVVFNRTGLVVPSVIQSVPATAADPGSASMSPNAGVFGWTGNGTTNRGRSFTYETGTGWYAEAVALLNGSPGAVLIANAVAGINAGLGTAAGR